MLRAGIKNLIQRLKRAAKREDGSSTIEFVILFPAIMTIFLSAFEVSIYLTRTVLLESSLDVNIRALRLGSLEPATHEELKRRVCEDALIFKDCPSAVLIELTPVSTVNWNLPAGNIRCVDRRDNVEPVTAPYNAGLANDLMVLRACAVLDPFFGTTPLVMDLPKDASGGVSVVAVSTFVNEP